MLRLFVATCARSWVRTPVEKNNLFRPLTNVVASRFMSSEPTIPPYEDKFDEPLHEKRARLMYQSRKRGMLENGLLLGSFANKYLPDFNEEQLVLYDRLINLPSNDWDIFYWATEKQETPEEFQNQIMDLLKEHAKNKDRESRIRLPDLKTQ
jgi:succinate dehydrogenase assembly factor 2